MFIHLHNHSHYSILEGLPKPKDYVKKAVDLGMTAVAITDTSNVHGCHELYKECKYAGIKPIMGTEIFVRSSLDANINHKLVLLAKSLKGYHNILALTSKASLDNAGKIPRIDFEDIVELKNSLYTNSAFQDAHNYDNKINDLDIVCLSGPISGEIPYFILSGKTDEEILSRIKQYQDLFGVENYYLELMYHDDIPKQKLVTDKLIEIYKNYDIPVVATNNCFYIDREDKKTQDVIKALGTGHELENPDRPTMINGDYSFLDEEEMQIMFGFIPDALENTVKIADMVDIKIETGGILIPTFELPEEHQKIYEEALEVEKGEYYVNPSPQPSPSEERGQEQNNEASFYPKGEGIQGGNPEDYVKKLTSDEWYLRYLSFAGLNWRYKADIPRNIIFKLVQKLDKPSLTKQLTETSPEELKALSITYYSEEKKQILSTLSQDIQDKIERLEYELVVVHEMGFDAYFLIVADYINWARSQDIPVGPGRGSAAGSLMAFLSGITDIDPLPYKLLFERFLNPARVSMPDIDTDFADTERDRVIKYCSEKYGADRVVNICTFGTFAARAAVKDVGRVFGIPFAEMNNLAKLIPEKPGTKLRGALEDSIEFREAYETNPKYKEIIDNALKIEGNVRQLGVHACAVIIAPESMTKFTALQHPPKDPEAVVTQYSAYPLEDLGLLKMDFLGLRNLTVIKRAQNIIKSSKNINVDILDIDLNDPKVFKIFANGDTTGVFQFESDGMRKYLKDLAPDSFEDLIAMVSLYRPGPLAYIPTYIDVKYKRKELKYLTDDLRKILEDAGYPEEDILEEKRKLDEDLAPILDVSYGIAVYQEQLMFIVQYMAGFSLGEADLLRRGVGKKKLDVIEALKKEFIEKGIKYRQYKPETTNYIYTEMIMPAANYSFNKSHAACYAFIAYQTAYLKAYYPTEFLTSLMVSDEENMERIVLEVGECQMKSISVLPPSVNQSLKHFTYIDDKNVRFGLKAIKGIGEGPIDRVIVARQEIGGKFESLEQFIDACGKEVINKKSLEALIMSGAMDDLGIRQQMFKSIEDLIRFSRKDEKKKASSQIGLFDNSDDFEEKLELVDVSEFSYEELLKGEKEMIGFAVSGHALDGLQRYCLRRSNNIKKLKMDMSELLELDKKENPEKYLTDEEKAKELEMGIDAESSKKDKEKTEKKERKEEIVQAVGVIVDMRKIVTKTGKTMVFLKCEGFDYDFEVVIFPKDVDKYKDKLDIDKIIIINGILSVNFEYARKSIQARDIKIATISMVREQAKDLGLFSEVKRYLNVDLNKSDDDEVLEKIPDDISPEENCDDKCAIMPESFEDKLEEKIIENKSEINEQLMDDKFVINIPVTAKKEDLLELKTFMGNLDTGFIKIYLNLRGQEIDTKMSLTNLDSLKSWLHKKWN
ncbi:MAG: DNA polymerase III subunit alpha [Candidatus Gracilibacteria bacterium]|nr:DNA polymerase III subunit alpha [Candidatus Gracilibacteria bacterium]